MRSLVLGASAVVLLLAGCSGGGSSPEGGAVEAGAPESVPAATVSADAVPDDVARYLSMVRMGEYGSFAEVYSDDELAEYGFRACAELASGGGHGDAADALLEADVQPGLVFPIPEAAVATLCPEMSEALATR
jgi:hypothetical protein